MEILEFLVIVCIPLWCSYISKSTLKTAEEEVGINPRIKSKYYAIPSRFIRKIFKLKKQKMLKHFIIAYYLIFYYLLLSPISFILYFFIYENKLIYLFVMSSEIIIGALLRIYIVIVSNVFEKNN